MFLLKFYIYLAKYWVFSVTILIISETFNLAFVSIKIFCSYIYLNNKYRVESILITWGLQSHFSWKICIFQLIIFTYNVYKTIVVIIAGLIKWAWVHTQLMGTEPVWLPESWVFTERIHLTLGLGYCAF